MDKYLLKDNHGVPAINKLSDSEDYYNNVFKKTERIVSATLYILSFITPKERQSTLIQRTEQAAIAVHDTALASLTWSTVVARGELFVLQHALVSLESNVRVLIAAGLIPESIVSALSDEVDATLRYLKNHYSQAGDGFAITRESTAARPSVSPSERVATSRPRRLRPTIPHNDLSSDAYLVYSDLNDRATRIKTVLDATPNATIKDLAEVITDVSSKTIQRELNSLIEKSEVKREGERRWSTYTLMK